MTTRDTTPASSAPRCGTPVPGGRCAAPAEGPAAAAAVETRAPFDRHRWERAVITSSLHHTARHVALTLAHFADDAGYLAPGGPQQVDSLIAVTGHSGRFIRQSLSNLELYGLISRPNIHSWNGQKGVRPITLTMPPARTESPAAAEGAVRTEPVHPGEAM